MGRTEGEAAFIASLKQPRKIIVEQYLAVGDAYEELWKAIYPRIEYEEWADDGLGSCKIKTEHSEQGVSTQELRWLRLLRLSKRNPQMKTSGCGHHEHGSGCTLGGMKSPLCFDFMPPRTREEIESRFGICLLPIERTLKRIQWAGINPNDPTEDYKIKPEKNAVFVEEKVKGIRAVIEHVESFPIVQFGEMSEIKDSGTVFELSSARTV